MPMKFRSFKGKKVMCEHGIITFTNEEYETKCKVEIEALKSAKQVLEVKAQKPKAKG